MLVFPNSKINLGLYVTSKRADGFHELLTCFYPLNWCDALEVTENKQSNEDFSFTATGRSISGKLEDNLIYKCWLLLKMERALPPIQVHLHKNIPMGAGLGGGSSDSAFFLNLMDQKFDLALPYEKKMQMAASLGSDCPFFLLNRPVIATGRGETFHPFSLSLKSKYILCIYPDFHSSTSRAFAGITPIPREIDLALALQQPIETWSELIVNDFETPVFSLFPALSQLKQNLYSAGALYAAMSGSGSAIYGIFNTPPDLSLAQNYSYYLQIPEKGVL